MRTSARAHYFNLLDSVRLQKGHVPSAREMNLDSFSFDDFSLEPDQMLQASLRMFIDCGFIDEFHIDYEVKIGYLQSWKCDWQREMGLVDLFTQT